MRSSGTCDRPTLKRSKNAINRPLASTTVPVPRAVFLDGHSHRLRSCGLARPMLHARPCIEHRGQIEDARSWRRSPLAHRHSATDVRLSRCARPNPHAPHVLPARPVRTAHCASSMGRVTWEVRGTTLVVRSKWAVVGAWAGSPASRTRRARLGGPWVAGVRGGEPRRG